MSGRYLIDTHVLIWLLVDPDRLRGSTRETLADRSADVFVSAISSLEIAIKLPTGRLPPLPESVPEAVRRLGCTPLPVTHDDAFDVRDLPPHHRDPFDRVLVAQARRHGLTLVTRDRTLSSYDVPVLTA